jgi:hypothetical protein
MQQRLAAAPAVAHHLRTEGPTEGGKAETRDLSLEEALQGEAMGWWGRGRYGGGLGTRGAAWWCGAQPEKGPHALTSRELRGHAPVATNVPKAVRASQWNVA